MGSQPHSSWDDPSGTDHLLPRVNTGLVVLVAALVSAGAVVGLHLLQRRGGITGVEVASPQVPEVVGMTESQARLAAENSGLTLQVMGRVHDPFVPEGKVAKQVPLAGQPAVAGSNLAVTLSGGPAAVTTPNVVGMELPKAVERLVSAGLRVGGTRYRPDPRAPDNQVLATDPAAGAAVKPGAQVGLVVSRAKTADAPVPEAAPAPRRSAGSPGKGGQGGMVMVPKVVGVRLRWATGRLSARGLTVGKVTYFADEDHMDGYILRQSPAPGASVPRGTAVNVTVNQTN